MAVLVKSEFSKPHKLGLQLTTFLIIIASLPSYSNANQQSPTGQVIDTKKSHGNQSPDSH